MVCEIIYIKFNLKKVCIFSHKNGTIYDGRVYGLNIFYLRFYMRILLYKKNFK